MLPVVEPMSFVQRLMNLFLEGMMEGVTAYIDGLQMPFMRKHFGQEIPDFYDIAKERSALTLVNSHFITHGIWPTYPNYIDIGGKV